jgi:hypothetical protein
MATTTTGPAPSNPVMPEMPRMWVGYVIAVIFLIAEFVEVAQSKESIEVSSPGSVPTLLISLGGWIYWLYCVYKFHDAVAQVPGYTHPITPARAVALHWIPLYNFYWVFKWPSEMETFVNWRTQSQSMKGAVAGGLVLVSVLLMRFVDGFIGLTCLFTSGVYIERNLRRAFSAPPVPAEAMARPGAQGILGV